MSTSPVNVSRCAGPSTVPSKAKDFAHRMKLGTLPSPVCHANVGDHSIPALPVKSCAPLVHHLTVEHTGTTSSSMSGSDSNCSGWTQGSNWSASARPFSVPNTPPFSPLAGTWADEMEGVSPEFDTCDPVLADNPVMDDHRPVADECRQAVVVDTHVHTHQADIQRHSTGFQHTPYAYYCDQASHEGYSYGHHYEGGVPSALRMLQARTASPLSLAATYAAPLLSERCADTVPIFNPYTAATQPSRAPQKVDGARSPAPSNPSRFGNRKQRPSQSYVNECEQRLEELTVLYMRSTTVNPYRGSVPVERIQNILRSENPDVYNAVVGTRHNSWRMFIQRHDSVFALFTVEDGKWRMRLVSDTEWEAGDARERQERQSKEQSLITCVVQYLKARPDGKALVDDFMADYDTLPQHQNSISVPLPARGDLIRFVRRHGRYFHYNPNDLCLHLVR